MSLREALSFIHASTAEDLRTLSKETLLGILRTLNPEDVQTVIFAKNIKIFGGINGYIQDFFANQTVQKILAMPEGVMKEMNIQGLQLTLRKMDKYDGVTLENKERIVEALQQVSITYTAPAAGGKQKKSRKNKKRKLQ